MVRVFVMVCFMLCSMASQANVHHAEAFLERISGTPDEGLQIVNHYCASCHASKPIISLGAPRIHHAMDWNPRLKQGLDSLLGHVYEGLNAMPPRGGCFECTDKQLVLAIKAMLSPSDERVLFQKRHIKKQKDKNIIK